MISCSWMATMMTKELNQTKHKGWLRFLGALVSLGLFMLALAVIHVKLRQYSIHNVSESLRQMPLGVLGLAVGLTILNYMILTCYDVLALRYIRHPLPYRKVLLGSFIGYVFSNNTTIAGGSAARYRIYSGMGINTAELARLVGFCALSFWLGFLSLAAVTFLIVPTHLPASVHVSSGWVRCLGILCGVLVTAYLILVARRKSALHWGHWHMPLPSWSISWVQLFVASADWLVTASILYTLLPQGTPIGFLHFLSLFLLAQWAGVMSFVPGGLGVFESAMLLLMSGQVPAHDLIGSLLLMRVLFYLLPLLLGAVLLGLHEIAPGLRLIKRWGVALGRWSVNVIPTIFSVTTLLAGAVLLFSGALPAEQGRMAWLRDTLPLPAVELSHFLGSLIGAALLILSRGLQRRLDGAYHLSVWLLLLGALMSLIKGLDYEEAVLLSLMLLALLPCKGQFHRKASLLSGSLTPNWIIWVTMVLIATIWLGLFSYKRVEYSHDLWWHFAFQADAPRFLRATTGAVVVLLCFGLMRLLRPGVPPALPGDPADLERVNRLVQDAQQASAHLALLGDKRFLFNTAQDTFIMYAIEGRSWIALGDPVGPEENWDDLLWDFRELCDRYDGRPVFYQISGESLGHYIKLGLSFIKLGEEAHIDLSLFHLEGHERRNFRYVRNKLTRDGYSFEVLPSPLSVATIADLKTISDAWLTGKHTREKGFSLGFFNPAYIAQCPVILIKQGLRTLAFANLWPGAHHEELSVDLMRYLPDSPNEIMDFLFVELMLWGQQQGYQWFNLGMAPLSGLEDHDLAPFWSQAGAFVFRVGEHFYNFQGLRAYKNKFQPVWQPKYLACPHGLALPGILTNLVTLISGGLKGLVTK